MKTIHIIYYIPIPRNKTEIVSKATYIPKPQTTSFLVDKQS